MNSNDFVTINDILADVLDQTADPDARVKTKGWYVSQIQQGLEELSFDTFFDEQTGFWSIDQETCRVVIPAGAFNIQEIYIIKGECSDPDEIHNVYWKRNFNNASNIVTSQRRPGYGDVFQPHDTMPDMFYANVQNGVIMLDKKAEDYDYLKVVYNGMSVDIGDTPIIPRFFRQAVKDFTVERFFRSMKTLDQRQYRQLHADARRDLLGNGPREPGSWEKAEYRAKTMDAWERQNIRNYIARANF